MRRLTGVALVLAGACLASGCAIRASTAAGKGPTSRGDQLGAAVASPLNDFNLVQIEIPPVLLEAKAKPYGSPAKLECAPLLAEVLALDAALGPDVDAPPDGSQDKSLADAGTTAVGDAAVNAFRTTVENLVPFRGWVRRLSGADSHEREVAAALAAGMARRAYLKGLMFGHECLKMGEKAKAPLVPAGAAAVPATPAASATPAAGLPPTAPVAPVVPIAPVAPPPGPAPALSPIPPLPRQPQ